MVRDHVPKGTGRIVIAAALFNAEIFRDSDLHMVDEIAVPDRLENAVAETKDQNVLHRFFAEIMVDAIDLVFRKYFEKIVC